VLYNFLSSNYPISLLILVIVGLWVYRSRSSILLAMTGDSPAWNLVGKVAVGSTALFFVWATVLDNWRQLLGNLILSGREYAADPFESGATPEMLRYVTLALLAVSLVSVALVYARHHGAYVLLIVSLILAPVVAFTFNEIRISADAFLRLSETALQDPQWVDAGFIIFWATGMFVIIGSVLVAAYFMLFALIALPIRVVYGLLSAKKEEQLARIFESYEERARRSRLEHEAHSNRSHMNHDVPAP
jgi:hypothetical protein